MKNTWKKLLAMTLAASMLTGMMGVGAWAEGDGTGEETRILICDKEEHTHTSTCCEDVGWEKDGKVENDPNYMIGQDTLYYKITCGQKVHEHSDENGCYAVAMIGDTGYATLQAAINAAQFGDTVQLLGDVDLGNSYLSVNKNITLDLNNKTISSSQANGAFVVMANTLTVDDTSVEKNGAIKGTNNFGSRVYGAAAIMIVKNGTVNGAEVGIYTVGNVDIEGGSVTGNKYGIQLSGNKAVTVNDGTVTGNTIGIAATNGTVNVIDGMVSSNGVGINAQKNAKAVNVTGGTVTGTGTAGVIARGNVTATVASTVKSENGYGAWAYDGATLNVNDGADISGESGIIVGYNPDENDIGATLNMTGGKVTGIKYGISGNGSNDNTTITISGGEVTSAATAIYHPQVGDMTISDGTITGMIGVQYSGAGRLTISGGNITATQEYTVFPQKSPEQNDGTIADGAALSIISRGGGWQSSEDEVMDVTVTGGTFVSEHNSAVAVYRVAKVNGQWQIGDDTGLASYLESLIIAEGEDGSVPVFIGNPEKGVLDIEELAMGAKHITGGTFSEDIDDTTTGKPNYVDEGYESHRIQSGYPYADVGYFNVHVPVEDRADCVTCTPATPSTPGTGGGGDTTTYYTLTINYVDEDGNGVAAQHRERLESGSRYSVTSPSVEGMTPDQAVVEGRLTSSTTIDVVYTADEPVVSPEPTETLEPTPTESPVIEDLGENDTPLAELPTETEQPATEPPKEEIEELEDGDVPMAEAPETGDDLGIWLMMSAGALFGLAWLGKKKEEA